MRTIKLSSKEQWAAIEELKKAHGSRVKVNVKMDLVLYLLRGMRDDLEKSNERLQLDRA